MQGLTRDWILKNVEFSAIAADPAVAIAAEPVVRRLGLGDGPPGFNPLL